MNDIIMSTDVLDIDQIKLLVSTASTGNLTNDIITLPVFLGDAHLHAKEMLPNWSTYTGDNLDRLKSIVRKITAVKLLSSTERKQTTSVDVLSFSIDLVKAKELIEIYKQEIIDSVNYLNSSDPDGSGGVSGSSYATEAGVFDSC